MAIKHIGTWYEQSAYKRGKKAGFGAGKRVGMWLAYNEPWKQEERDKQDKEVARQSRRERVEPAEGKYDAYAEQPEASSSSSSSSAATAVFEVPRSVSPPADYSPRAVSPVRAAQPAVSAESDVFAQPAVRKDVLPEKQVVPELPLDQYAPDGYNEYTTKQLRDRIAELRRLGRESELNKLLRVVANRRKQDIKALQKAVRERVRQDIRAAREPKEQQRLAANLAREQQDRQEREEYERLRAQYSINTRDLGKKLNLERDWKRKMLDRARRAGAL